MSLSGGTTTTRAPARHSVSVKSVVHFAAPHGPHVAAKTGYIRDVFSLSGFLFGQTDTFAFSFIVNGCGSGTRAYELFNSLLNTVYGWNAGEAVATPGPRPDTATRQN